AAIVLWELSAGRRLYRGSDDEMIEQAREGRVQPLPARGLPDQGKLQAILDRALARDPNDRYESAAAFSRALDSYAMGNKLFASQLPFPSFLSEHFEADLLAERRERERAAEALEHGPPAVIEPIEVPLTKPKAISARPMSTAPRRGPIDAAFTQPPRP